MPHESITTPHDCRWLQFKDDPQPQTPRSNWTEVLCGRVQWRQRMVVPALDCVGCRYWESTVNARRGRRAARPQPDPEATCQ